MRHTKFSFFALGFSNRPGIVTDVAGIPGEVPPSSPPRDIFLRLLNHNRGFAIP